MLKVYLEGSCGVGMTLNDVVEVEDDVLAEALERMAWELAVDCANTYGSYISSEIDLEDDDDENGLFYDDQLDYRWELYDPEKHDMLKPGGGSWND
jgi:hypothetical protein